MRFLYSWHLLKYFMQIFNLEAKQKKKLIEFQVYEYVTVQCARLQL